MLKIIGLKDIRDLENYYLVECECSSEYELGLLVRNLGILKGVVLDTEEVELLFSIERGILKKVNNSYMSLVENICIDVDEYDFIGVEDKLVSIMNRSVAFTFCGYMVDTENKEYGWVLREFQDISSLEEFIGKNGFTDGFITFNGEILYILDKDVLLSKEIYRKVAGR